MPEEQKLRLKGPEDSLVVDPPAAQQLDVAGARIDDRPSFRTAPESEPESTLVGGETTVDVNSHVRAEQTVEVSEPGQQSKLSSSADPLIGAVLEGRYEILAFIGSGGMSRVYKARHILLNKICAIKVISSSRSLDGRAIVRFQQEAKAATQLSHKNIVAVREFGLHNQECPFLAMDYVSGKTLAQVINENGPLEPQRAINIFLQICDALEYAHEKGIIHRDIKPANIVIQTEGDRETALLLDFGVAKIIGDETTITLTQTGELIGSPMYMSPEQCLNKKLDARSDLYSLGCVLFEALSGAPPFKAETALHLLYQHASTAPAKLKVKGSRINDLNKVVETLLRKHPDDRYHNAHELADELRAIANSKKIRRRFRSKRKLIQLSAACIVLFVACAALCVVGGWMFGQPKHTAEEWANIGYQSRLANDYSTAVNAYRHAVALNPVDEKSWYNLAITLVSMGGHATEAEHAARKAFELSPENFENLGTLSECMTDLGRLEEAESLARKALAIKPS